MALGRQKKGGVDAQNTQSEGYQFIEREAQRCSAVEEFGAAGQVVIHKDKVPCKGFDASRHPARIGTRRRGMFC